MSATEVTGLTMNDVTTARQVADARAWVADCTWLDDTSALPDAAIVAGVQRHYEGGWAGCLAAAGMVPGAPRAGFRRPGPIRVRQRLASGPS